MTTQKDDFTKKVIKISRLKRAMFLVLKKMTNNIWSREEYTLFFYTIILLYNITWSIIFYQIET